MKFVNSHLEDFVKDARLTPLDTKFTKEDVKFMENMDKIIEKIVSEFPVPTYEEIGIDESESEKVKVAICESEVVSIEKLKNILYNGIDGMGSVRDLESVYKEQFKESYDNNRGRKGRRNKYNRR